MTPEEVRRSLNPWQDAAQDLKPGEEYLNRTEKLLYRRLWEYIIAENWGAVGQVIAHMKSLSLI